MRRASGAPHFAVALCAVAVALSPGVVPGLRAQQAAAPPKPGSAQLLPELQKAENAGKIQVLRDVMDQWVELQKVLSNEKSEGKQAVQLLRQRIELLKEEIADLETKRAESQKGITEADEKKAELVGKKEQVLLSLMQLEKEVPGFEQALRRIQPTLPGPVLEKLAPIFARMPEPDKPTKVSLAERYQNVVAILNEVNKANMEINLASEIRSLGDGKSSEVKTLYIGLGQAFYINATGQKAGVGRPGPEGWVWSEDNSLAPKIKTAIDMLQSKTAAKFVSLPVEISR